MLIPPKNAFFEEKKSKILLKTPGFWSKKMGWSGYRNATICLSWPGYQALPVSIWIYFINCLYSSLLYTGTLLISTQ